MLLSDWGVLLYPYIDPEPSCFNWNVRQQSKIVTLVWKFNCLSAYCLCLPGNARTQQEYVRSCDDDTNQSGAQWQLFEIEDGKEER